MRNEEKEIGGGGGRGDNDDKGELVNNGFEILRKEMEEKIM